MNALEKSILKWEEKLSTVQNNLGEPFKHFQHLFGIDECPLCKLYYNNECDRCPIRKKTGLEYCVGSPYDGLQSYFFHTDYKLDKKLVSIIKKEIRFLKSLVKK